MSGFAKAQLLKYGWTEGKGLGKNENGITDALKPKLKFDTNGIGHKETDFSKEWWSTGYNNAANNIKVQSELNGVSISVTKDTSIELPKHLPNTNFSYGNFLKTSTLLNGNLVQEDKQKVSKVEAIEKGVKQCSLTDDELFKVCGGRTAHKGARHGLTLSGKLKRLEEQEKQLLEKQSKKTDEYDTDEDNLPLNNTSSKKVVLSKATVKRNKRRIDELSQQLNTLCNLDNASNTCVDNVKSKRRKQDSSVCHDTKEKGDKEKKEEEDKELEDILLLAKNKLDKLKGKKKQKKQVKNCGRKSCTCECIHKKKKRGKRRRNKEVQNSDIDLDDNTVNQFNHDAGSFSCPESPDTFFKNEANRLNHKIMKKKKTKFLKKRLKNMIQNVESIKLNDEDDSAGNKK